MASGSIKCNFPSFSAGNILASTIDNYKDAGIYQGYFSGIASLNSSWGILIVKTNPNVVTQVIISGGGIACRNYNANASTPYWDEWSKITF